MTTNTVYRCAYQMTTTTAYRCAYQMTTTTAYCCRLKNADLVVSGLEEVKQIVSDYEITLASQENMTSELKGLRNHKEELQV